jgi:hypothetical protein
MRNSQRSGSTRPAQESKDSIHNRRLALSRLPDSALNFSMQPIQFRRGVIRRVKDGLKAGWHEMFLLFEKMGVHLTPVHFYSGLPKLSDLKKHPDRWMKRSELPGIVVDLEGQLEILRRACLPFQNEYKGLSFYREAVRRNGESGYGEIESQALHGFARFYKPGRIVQVGCGVATHCLNQAMALNKTLCELICIEPFPNEGLKKSNSITLISEPVQAVSTEIFTSLRNNDMLLIDSTHAVQIGSDVNYLVLEVLPRLAPGVIVSFHDINFPYEYSRDFLNSLVFPLETCLLKALLIDNPKFQIMACLSHLHYDRRAALREIFPDYRPQADNEGLAEGSRRGLHFPSSLWLKTTDFTEV